MLAGGSHEAGRHGGGNGSMNAALAPARRQADERRVEGEAELVTARARLVGACVAEVSTRPTTSAAAGDGRMQHLADNPSLAER